MLIEVCLVIIAATLVMFVIGVFCIFFKVRQSISILQTDVHHLLNTTTRLVDSLNEFVETDLSTISKETSQLISTISDLSSDINNKSHSLNFLFKPFSFLSSKFGSDSSGESDSKHSTLPQILKWIASSAILFKTTKEFINGKR